MSEISCLLEYAEEREIQKETKDLYIAHFVLSKLSGTETMGYDKYMEAITSPDPVGHARTPEQIDDEFALIEENYRKRKEG